MDRVQIATRLMEIPAAIAEQELAVLEANRAAQRVKEFLTERESELLLNGAIDGKNAEIRAAQIRANTTAEREQYFAADGAVAMERVKLNALHNEFKALQVVAKLLSVGGDMA